MIKKVARKVARAIPSVPGLYPHPLAFSVEPRPVIIIGSGRSGTTMLRSMLNRSGEIVIPPESYVWPETIRLFMEKWRFLPWHVAVRRVLLKFSQHRDFATWGLDIQEIEEISIRIPRRKRALASIFDVLYRTYAEQYGCQSSRWGEKTPLNTLFLKSIIPAFPEGIYVHIVRDPRAVVSSYIRAGTYSRNITENTLEKATNRWLRSVECAEEARSILPEQQFIEIQYENLVTNPLSCLKNLFGFLHLRFSEDVLDFNLDFCKLGDAPRFPHHQRLQEPLSADRLNEWRKHLDQTSLDYIESRTRRWRGHFGYEDDLSAG